MKHLFRTIAFAALLLAVGCNGRQSGEQADEQIEAEVPAHDIRFGIIADN